MSDDDREPDIEGAERRAHHNYMERLRRDHLKDSFITLKHSIPSLQEEKVASRAQILKKTADYILFMRRKTAAHEKDIVDLTRQNEALISQIKILEKAKATGNYAADISGHVSDSMYGYHDSESNTSTDSDSSKSKRKTKKLKVSRKS